MFVMGKGSVAELQSSVLGILGKFTGETVVIKPDLAIYKVTLRKVAGPTENFNYYRYYATVVVENKGGDLEDSKIKLSAGPGQQHLFLKNSKEGFSLDNGKKYITDRYEVIFDASYNGGTIPFSIEMVNQEDADVSNNNFAVEVFELPAAVQDISLETVKDSGEYFVQFDDDSKFYDHSVDVYSGQLATSPEGEYLEAKGESGIYSYFRAPNTAEILKSGGFEKMDVDHLDSYAVNFGETLTEKNKPDYLFVKAVNPANGNYAVSDVLMLPSQINLSRGDEAKFFIELTGEQVDSMGETGFADVDGTEWYAPYAKSIYNLGLINFDLENFEGEKTITRKQVLRMVMDYFDADITGEAKSISVNDVESSDQFYHYLANFSENESVVTDGSFGPDEPASLAFLKYVIYAYK